MKKPIVKCYGCDRRAARGKMFFTLACAAGYAEELMEGNDEEFCPTCGLWQATHFFDPILSCNHPKLGLKKGN